MSRNPPHRCEDCGILLSRHYPYAYCPRCWRNRFDAPPGESRFTYFEAAANPARVSFFASNPKYELHTGGTIAASRRSSAAAP